MAVQNLYQRIRKLISRVFTDQEKQLLVNQVENLKNQLQSALEHIVSQNQNAAEISKKLQSEVKENKTLWDQIEYLTTELNKERILREKHICPSEKANFQEAQKLRNNLNKQLEEMQKQLVEQERQQEMMEQRCVENYSKLDMTVAQYSELKKTGKNLKHTHEETDQRHDDTEIEEEKHRNTLLQQKLQEAECIISEQNVILDQIKQEIQLLQQKHHEDTTNVSQLATNFRARVERKECHVFPLNRTAKDLREDSTGLWRWNAPRTC